MPNSLEKFFSDSKDFFVFPKTAVCVVVPFFYIGSLKIKMITIFSSTNCGEQIKDCFINYLAASLLTFTAGFPIQLLSKTEGIIHF